MTYLASNFKYSPFLAYLFCVLFYSLLVILYDFTSFGITNLVFVDGVNWTLFVRDISNGIYDLSDIRSSELFLYTNYILYFIGGTLLVFLFNISILSNLFLRSSSPLLILFIPFYVTCSFLVSKDILVLVCTLAYFYFLVRNKTIYLFIVSVISFYIRDGFGFFLLLFTVINYLNLFSIRYLILAIASMLIIDFFITTLNEIYPTFMLGRTLNISSEIGIQYPYILRLVGNIFNLATRPVFFTEQGSFSLTSFTLFLSGVGIIFSFFHSFYNLFFCRASLTIVHKRVIFMLLYSFVLLSFSPLVQPRYLISIAYIYIMYFSLYPFFKSQFIFFLTLSFMVTIFGFFMYLLLGNTPIITDDYNVTPLDIISNV